MSDAPVAPKKKALKVNVLRCRGEDCGALMAYEETSEGVLMGNMYGLAERDGDKAFFPCPRCSGRNLVEEVSHGGKTRARVFGFEPAGS